ncbi:MAG TPA: hypothetical protein VGO93_08545 [Candidatus Xenobia bacterium]|jgi:hypothetical protein
MPGTERAVSINWNWGFRPVRLMVVAIAIVLLGLVHGVGMAAKESLRAGMIGFLGFCRALGQGQVLPALWALVEGLARMLVVWPTPLVSNFLVGLGACLELCRHAFTEGDHHFEMMLFGDNSVSFLARCGELFTRAEVVKVAEHTCYPIIECVEVVTPSFLDDEDEVLDMFDTSPSSIPMPFVGGFRNPATEYAAASVVDGLRRFADY